VVLPTLAQCAATPTAAGCTLILPAAIAITPHVAQVEAIVTVALNTTVNIIATPGIAKLPAPMSDDKNTDAKSDGAPASGTSENSSTKPGVTNDAAKKMYCN
jgi:hypothetical protein